MSFTYKFDDGAEVTVSELTLSSKEMRKLRSRSELDIAYDLLEEKLSEDELASVESYTEPGATEDAEPATKDRAFTEVMGFFNKWFEGAVEGK